MSAKRRAVARLVLSRKVKNIKRRDGRGVIYSYEPMIAAEWEGASSSCLTETPHLGCCRWARDEMGDEWEEQWGENYSERGQASKWADKWARQAENVWHERWGEEYDGGGGCVKYTDKWAERLGPEGEAPEQVGETYLPILDPM